jgi:hypothetical protein
MKSIRRIARFLCSFIMLGALISTPLSVCAGTITVTIGASKDATIFQNNPNNSSGAGNGLFAGTNGTSSPRRGLIAFDVAGSVPAGATIDTAQLTLYLAQVAGAGGGGPGGSDTSTIDLHRLSADWGEGVTQKQVPPNDTVGGQGQGDPANDGDATWNARFYSATTPTLWNTPGGDFSATSSASLTIGGTTTGVPYTWSSTAGLVSDVQSWLNTPSSNFGWILVNTDETSIRTFRAFFTREAATAAYHPQLQITYSLPLLGDFNQDGHVNSADISTAMAAMTNLQSYETSEHLTDPQQFLNVADVNHDGTFNVADLQAILILLKSGGGSNNSVPEPSTLVLCVLAAFMLGGRNISRAATSKS